MSKYQKQIINYALANNGRISKVEAVNLIGGNYFHNAEKYTGEVLTRMIKAKVLNRVRRGMYELPTGNGGQQFGLFTDEPEHSKVPDIPQTNAMTAAELKTTPPSH
jgi:hypothetical protein